MSFASMNDPHDDALAPGDAPRRPSEEVPQPGELAGAAGGRDATRPRDETGLQGDVEAQLAAARAEIAELKDAWLRARAETDNVRRQAANEREKTRKYAVETFAASLLPVRDSLEAALSNPDADPRTLRDGVELTLKLLDSAFEKAQIVNVDPHGEPFDPHRHEAMSAVPSSQPANTVVQVFQKGYLLQDRVLRPALVAVARSEGAA
jgi:molecular chaperone GrpE